MKSKKEIWVISGFEVPDIRLHI